jgi:hypothetical protein
MTGTPVEVPEPRTVTFMGMGYHNWMRTGAADESVKDGGRAIRIIDARNRIATGVVRIAHGIPAWRYRGAGHHAQGATVGDGNRGVVLQLCV